MDNSLSLNQKPDEASKETEFDDKRKTDEIVKITISKESEQKLMGLLKNVNDGFVSGRVNRQDLASWILVHFCSDCNETQIESIRADHFDEIMMFESILKKSKETGVLPPEFQALLKQQVGTTGRSKPRKALTK